MGRRGGPKRQTPPKALIILISRGGLRDVREEAYEFIREEAYEFEGFPFQYLQNWDHKTIEIFKI